MDKILRVGTFNLFQFVKPPYCWYEKQNSFLASQWDEKIFWIKTQIQKMNCDIVGFQEVFSEKSLEKISKELGYNYFVTVDTPKTDEKDPSIFITTTVALASKYPILEILDVPIDENSITKHNFESDFKFSRRPIKTLIELPNKKQITVYVNHFKSNKENELEYIFNKDHTLEEKKTKTQEALDKNISKSLKQRLCETSSLFYDFKKTDTPIISLCDLNDKEFSLTIEALTNQKYHYNIKDDSYILYDCYNLLTRTINNPHPEQKKIKRTPTSYFKGKGDVLDYIFLSKEFLEKNEKSIGKIISYEVFNQHLNNNPHGTLTQSDHAQVVCEIQLY